MEADFRRYYGVDLRDAVEDESARWLWAHIEALPPDSAYARMMQARGPEPQEETDPNAIMAFLGRGLN